MPAYNAGLTISESINSVLNQTYENFEVIVINDGSLDNTIEKVLSFIDPRIKLINKINGGVASARNLGIYNSKGEYLAFLDSDDLWHPEKLEKSLEVLGNSSCDLLYTNYYDFQNTIELAIKHVDLHPMRKVENDYIRLSLYDYIPTLTVVIKKNVIDIVGTFDEDLNGTEDWDLWLRVTEKYKIVKLNQYLAYYRFSENGLSKQKERHLKEEKKVILKHKEKFKSINQGLYKVINFLWYTKNFFYNMSLKRFDIFKYFFLMIVNFPFDKYGYLYIKHIMNSSIRKFKL